MERSSTVLLHLTSLPGPFAAGTIGAEALAFGLKMVEAGFTYWQILPLGQPAEASPYECLSAFAGNVWLIDPRKLCAEGYLYEHELEQFYYRGSVHHTDFAFLRENSRRFLDLAYSRINAEQLIEMELFAATQSWLKDYAIFMVAREKFGRAPWWEWPDIEMAAHDAQALEDFYWAYQSEVEREIFAQWIFARHWSELKSELNRSGLGIFGDMPYYVAHNSADVWANKDFFDLGADFLPREIAGVPPDYFAVDGQLWGFPVYDWKALKAAGFSWWIARLKHELERYDLLRIDHFRGLSSYWAVPYGSPNARIGRWRKGPGMALFKMARQELGALPIVAEDLGVVDDGLIRLMKTSKFPGMKVLQFGLDTAYASVDLPHDYPRNSCAYTGTHDNNTLLGWLHAASPEVRAHALDYAAFPQRVDWMQGGGASPACLALIRAVWQSPALMAAAPLQDFLGYGEDTRMNIPGQTEHCWTFRLTGEALQNLDSARMLHLNRLYRRNRPYMTVQKSITEDMSALPD